jgi:hypothetical protein
MAADFERDFPGHRTYLSGDVFMSTSFFEAGAGDMSTLTPIMYLVLIVLLVVLLRSVYGMLAALTIVLCSMVCAMGFAGWAGIPLTPPGALAPTVVMTLAIADSIHFLITVIHEMSRGRSKHEAIVESLRLNLLPIVVTSVTTAIGFLCLNFNDSPPFHDLGNITAAGVMAAMVFSLSLLPVLADLFPIRVSRRSLRVEQATQAAFGKLGPFVTARARYFIVAIPVVALALLAAIPSMRINDNFRTIFDHSFQFRRDSDYMLENLTGMWRIEFSVPSGGPRGVSDPVYLAKLEEFSDYLRGDERVLNVSSFSDVMKRINRSMHGDRSEYYRVPDEQPQAAQYLLLYELSLPLGLDLNNMIDVDRSSTRVNATTGDLGSGELIELTGRAEAWLAANAPEYMQTVGSGAVMMFAHITERNIYGMLKGMGIAAVLLTLIMITVLGSVKYGLLSLVPNLIPACMAFGIWSIAVGEVGFAISVVGSATLGIIVDDTVHFLSKYVKMRRETGASAEQALAHCFRGVGPAICATTILLVAGFGVMSLSHFGLNSTLGLLTMLTISIALFLDLLLLPSILFLIDGGQESPAPAGASLASPLLEREAK